jgi:TetR/AcrR family transcriptional repressor of nem operon
MKKMNVNSPRKEALLNAANSLMLEKGFVATSVDEVCLAANVTKGSFFHYFKNKQALGKELVIRFYKMTSQLIEEGSSAAGSDPLDRVYAFIDTFVKMSENPEAKGCLVGTFAQELTETHPEIRDLCSECFSGLANLLKDTLIQAKAKYLPDVSLDIESLGDYFVALSQGSLLIVKAHQDRSIIRRNMDHFKQYIKCVFGK